MAPQMRFYPPLSSTSPDCADRLRAMRPSFRPMTTETHIDIRLEGHVPSVKNSQQILRRKNGTPFLMAKATYRKAMDSLTLQARAAWRGRPPLEHPDLIVWIYSADRRGDRDNKLNAIMDILKHAKVIADDNIRRCNGTVLMPPAIVGKGEGAVIRITPKQGLLMAEGADQTA